MPLGLVAGGGVKESDERKALAGLSQTVLVQVECSKFFGR